MAGTYNLEKLRKIVKEKFAGDFIKTLSIDILAKGFTFVFLPLYTRVMSEEDFGLFTYLYLIITTGASIIKVGMDTVFSKLFFDVDSNNRSTLTFVTNSIWAFTFLLLFILAWLTGYDKWVISLLIEKNINYSQIRFQFWFFIFLEMISTTLSVYYLVNERFRRFQLFNFIKIFITNFCTFSLLYFFTKDKVELRLTSECVLGLLIFMPLIIEVFKSVKIEIDKPLFIKAFKIGFPMMGSILISTIYLFADRYFIQKYSGLNSLAIYNFCMMLTLPISLFFTSFNTIWFPKFAKEKDLGINFRKTTKITIILFGGFLVLSLFVWFILIILLKISVIKDTYYPSLSILPVIFMSRILDTLSNLYTNFVVILGKTTFNFLLVLFLSVFTFVLNYFLTPTYGTIAASIILFVVSFFRILALFLFSRHNAQGIKIK